MSLSANSATPDFIHLIPPPSSHLLRNGNPSGNPNAAPRCGAKNRAGCPCRSPAMPNGRCRLHGGKSTGPRTPEGQARSATANTRHGNTTAPERVYRRYIRTLIKRSRLRCHARLLWPYLPEEMAARLAKGPEELWTPIHPSNLPFVQTPDPPETATRRHPTQPGAPARALPHALAAERAAAQAEATAQAPWRQAIRFARTAKRERLAARRAYRATRRAARAARRAARAQTPAADARPPQALLPPPNVPLSDYTPLERELAARLAGLRANANQPDQLTPHATNSDSTLPRINPMNPESGPTPAPNPDSTLPGINPQNPEPDPTPAQNPNSAPPRINPMNPEPPPRRRPTHLTPTKALALRSTTQSNTWQRTLHALLTAHLARSSRSPATFTPQAPPPATPSHTATAIPQRPRQNRTA